MYEGSADMLKRFLFAALLLTASLPAAAQAPVIAILGDSLSAAYGIPAERGWTALLQQRLAGEGYRHQVVNASISGDTTRGGLTRLPSLLEKHRPGVLVVELGGNDGLRGVPIAETRANLTQIIERAQAAGAKVVLVGVQLPPNYGKAFTKRFAAMFDELAREHAVPLVPFALERIANDSRLMQDDGIHPTAEAQPMMLDLVWPKLKPVLGAPPAKT